MQKDFCNTIPPMADILGGAAEGYHSCWRVTLAHPTGIRTWSEFGFKLSFWRFTFLNYTKSTKYEALEKNEVSG
jgi:hypothetical protein